jgi:FkbM family methyltransferase
MHPMLLRILNRAVRLLPGHLTLPAMVWVGKHSTMEPEVAFLAQIGPCRGTAVDIGANSGIYSYELTRLYDKVIAFEPNPAAAKPLVSWNSAKVNVLTYALSDQPGVARLFVPTSAGIEMNGWASLDRDNCPDAEGLVELQVELRSLDSFGLKDVGFIKIDAEGHELEVLRGARDTIMASRPHLLIEIRKRAEDVLFLIEDLGYESFSLLEMTGHQGAPQNFLFRPRSPFISPAQSVN